MSEGTFVSEARTIVWSVRKLRVIPSSLRVGERREMLHFADQPVKRKLLESRTPTIIDEFCAGKGG